MNFRFHSFLLWIFRLCDSIGGAGLAIMYVTARFSFYLSRIDLFYSCVNWGESKIGHRSKKSSISHDNHNWLGQHRSDLLEFFFWSLLLSLFAPFLYLTRLEKMKTKILSTVDSPGLFVSKTRSIGKWHHHHTFLSFMWSLN